MKAVDQLEALENFAVFAEAESLRAAARTLGMVPSTLLRRMRALEKDFGRRLFAASPRGIALTPEGMALHAKVARILSGMNAEAPGDAAGISGSGPIRIAADPVLSVGTILSAVGALCEERNLRIEVVRPGRLSRPDILLKILRGNSLPGSRGQFALVPLPRRILAASPASIERRGLTIAPEYLERQHILRIDGDEAPIEQMGPAGEEAQLLRELPPPAFLLPDAGALLESTLTGEGLAAGLSRLDAERALSSGQLIQVLPEWVFPEEHLALELSSEREDARALAAELARFFEGKAGAFEL